MKRQVLRPAFLFSLLLVVACAAPRPRLSPRPQAEALILYDLPDGPAFVYSFLHVKMLKNLLGHFPIEADALPLTSYRSGDLASYQSVFYIGERFGAPQSLAFLADARAALEGEGPTLVWIKHNFAYLYPQGYEGLSYVGVEGDAENYRDRVVFCGRSYLRRCEQRADGTLIGDPFTVLYEAPTDSIEVLASAEGNAHKPVPWALHRGKLWVFASNPLAFATETSPYLVFAELLHDILGRPHEQKQRAYLRLEDVHPERDPRHLRSFADFCHERGLPFSVAVIPVFREWDGSGWREIRLSGKPDLVEALRYMTRRGGTLIMHGTTHQNDSGSSGGSRRSAEDYEFFNAGDLAPEPDEDLGAIQSRLARGIAEFKAVGLKPVAWETPHYLASPLASLIIADTWHLAFQRVMMTVRAHGRAEVVLQHFPYLIERDIYGQRILPENLGLFYPDDEGQWNTDEILSRAAALSCVRDASAGLYLHPFLWNDVAARSLDLLVDGLERQGFTFSDLSRAD